MTRDPEKYLFDILDSSRFLIQLTANATLERYRKDRAFRAAVERELQIVGEAMLQLKSVSPTIVAGITESQRIIGFRHVIVHGYFALEAETVWDVVKNKLPKLAGEVAHLLPQEDSEASSPPANEAEEPSP